MAAITGLIARKLGMTQVYNEEGPLVPVTVIQAGPCTVVATRRAERDGYAAAQVGFGPVKTERLSKVRRGQFQKAGTAAFRVLREFRLADGEEGAPAVGTEIGVSDVFHPGPPVPLPRVSKAPAPPGPINPPQLTPLPPTPPPP